MQRAYVNMALIGTINPETSSSSANGFPCALMRPAERWSCAAAKPMNLRGAGSSPLISAALGSSVQFPAPQHSVPLKTDTSPHPAQYFLMEIQRGKLLNSSCFPGTAEE